MIWPCNRPPRPRCSGISATGTPHRSKPRTTSQEIQVCARCHSRRSQLTDQAKAGDPLLDAFRPVLLTAGFYHADGQVEDEVYVWGSLLQSKMYQAGITCSDCHDPHSADLRLPGDQVCYQCHRPAKNYMVVDACHDHSFRVPRPDQSVTLGRKAFPNPRMPPWSEQACEILGSTVRR